jgi:hypothetical protein
VSFPWKRESRIEKMWIPAFAGKTVVHSHIKGSLDDWSQGPH